MRQRKTVADPAKSVRPRASRNVADRYRIHVIDRASQILGCFGFEHAELSVSEIGVRTHLHRSTAHRILMALEYNDLIRQNADTGRYHLGLRLFKLGHQAVSHLNLREVCRPYLQRLMNEIKETVHLAIVDDGQILYLEKVEGPHALRMPSRVGRNIPTYCTSLGKAMLSGLEDEEVRDILRDQAWKAFTPNTIRNIDQLLADLRVVRKRGYAVDNEEIEIGLRCIGAPIRDHAGAIIGAISTAAPSARLPEKKIPLFGRQVVSAAAEISAQLGYEKPRRLNA